MEWNTDTCRLDPPVPNLKLVENIHGCKIIFACFIHETFSNYYVRRLCLAHRHVFVSIVFRSRKKMKNLLYLVDILGCFFFKKKKTVTNLHETIFTLLTSDSVI